jgi:hypothetical protein
MDIILNEDILLVLLSKCDIRSSINLSLVNKNINKIIKMNILEIKNTRRFSF